MLFEIDGLHIHLHRKRVKRLNLRIQATGDVHMSIPMRLSLDIASQFIREKRSWIDEHRQRLQTKVRDLPTTLESGARRYFLGHPYEVIVHNTGLRPFIALQDEALHCYFNPSMSVEQKEALLHQWYRDEMQQRLPDLFQKWTTTIGVSITFYGVKLMKTRWGSCNPVKQRIWLNLRLIEKPLMCLESVIVHELVHLLEPSHNRRFYDLMSRYFPHWKQAKTQLESIGSLVPIEC